jgi:hypothetical protein
MMHTMTRPVSEKGVFPLMVFIAFFAIIVPVHAATPDISSPESVHNSSAPHYIYDPETGALLGYGTTPSPEEQKILDQIRGPGYSPFPAPTPLAMDIAPEQPVYAYGDSVTINISLSNAITDPFTFSRLPPELVISTRPDGWNRGIVRTLSHGEEMLVLKPHQTTSMILTWDQKNDQQIQVNPGIYYLTGQAGFTQIISPDSGTIISPNPGFINARSEVIVQHPQGALAGSLYPNTTVTDGEVTATLDSLEFNRSRGSITMTVHAPQPAEGSLAAPGFTQVTAEYYVDNGTAQDFLDCSSRYAGKGVSQVIWRLAPIPCDARKMHIAVTKFDPYRGHWNFTGDCADIVYCTVDNDTQFSRETMPDAIKVKKPATPQPAPFALTLTLAAFGIAGVLSVLHKKLRR